MFPRESGVRLFGKLRHSKAAAYTKRLRKPYENPGKMNSQKRPEKILRFHLRLILVLREYITTQ
jgi:hypothetical protein